jgi:hypothetical protein
MIELAALAYKYETDRVDDRNKEIEQLLTENYKDIECYICRLPIISDLNDKRDYIHNFCCKESFSHKECFNMLNSNRCVICKNKRV